MSGYVLVHRTNIYASLLDRQETGRRDSCASEEYWLSVHHHEEQRSDLWHATLVADAARCSHLDEEEH